MNATVLWQILAIALAVSAISTTIALSSLFKPVRRWARAHFHWFGNLISCAYCTSHWVAFFAVAWFHPRVFQGWWVANYVVVVFAVVAVANVVTGIVRKLNYFYADPARIDERAEKAEQEKAEQEQSKQHTVVLFN